jgi:hypothetical protein
MGKTLAAALALGTLCACGTAEKSSTVGSETKAAPTSAATVRDQKDKESALASNRVRLATRRGDLLAEF